MGAVAGDVGLTPSVADALSVGLLLATPDHRAVWANRMLVDLLGSEESGALLAAACPPGPGPHEVPWSTPDASVRWLGVTRRLVPQDSAHLVLHEVTDVTEQHEHWERAREREGRLSRVEALARMGTWEWDLDRNVIVWSDELAAIFGYPRGTEFDYLTTLEFVHPDDVDRVARELTRALLACGPFAYTLRMYLADGVTERIFESFGEVVTDDAGRPQRVLGTAHDITERRRAYEELTYLATHDPLTGLPNRRSVTAHLRERLALGDGLGALLLLDIDHFKDVNDVRGHAVGDQVMRGLAHVLRDSAPEGAVLGRLGGDEFAVVLPDGDAGTTLACAESLCDAIAARPIVADGRALRVTASIGVAPLARASDCDVLIANADLALYEAKRTGRNRARLNAQEPQRDAARRVSVLQRVQHALDEGRLGLDAQPIVELRTRSVIAHELLIRLRDGREPALGPAEFLPAVERTDLALRLDRWVVQEAVSALAGHRELCLAVNVSGRSVEDTAFPREVLATLHSARVDPARLTVELTESSAITNPDAAKRMVTQLTAAGCRVTLDDFGAGFGSFTHLRNLPCTAVKIAGELTHRADAATTDTVLVEAVARVARSLRMHTIAEAVDRAPLLDALPTLGVDCAQGYHLGRPQPLPALLVSSSHQGP